MRNLKSLLMVVVSLVAGLGALGLANRWLESQQVQSSNAVIVAAVNVAAGQQLNAQHLRAIEWPAGNVPAGAFRSEAELTDRVAKTAIARDEPVLAAKLAPKGYKGGMAAVIKAGKRAITVRVNDVVGVAGFALPGTFVDVMVNVNQGRQKSELAVSKIVLERILVLAIAQEASRDETQPKVVNAVTLEVTPQEAEKLDLARSVGKLSLVLRNHGDEDPTKTTGATPTELLGLKPKVVQPRVVRVVRRVEVSNPEPQRVCVDSWDGTAQKAECF